MKNQHRDCIIRKYTSDIVFTINLHFIVKTLVAEQ